MTTDDLKVLKAFLESLDSDWHIKQADIGKVLRILIKQALPPADKKEEKKR